MKRFRLVCSVGVLLVTGNVYAQQVKSPVVGIIKSGAKEGTGNFVVVSASAPPVTTAGSNQVFVVTDICIRTGVSVGVNIGGFVGGGIPMIGQEQCLHFDPGFVAGDGADVTCNVGGGVNTLCAVSGVVTAKKTTP